MSLLGFCRFCIFLRWERPGHVYRMMGGSQRTTRTGGGKICRTSGVTSLACFTNILFPFLTPWKERLAQAGLRQPCSLSSLNSPRSPLLHSVSPGESRFLVLRDLASRLKDGPVSTLYRSQTHTEGRLSCVATPTTP